MNPSSALRWFVLVTLLCAPALAQQRYTSGPFKGFQMAHPEGLSLAFAPLHSGTSLSGTVQLEGGAPIAGVVVELRGSGAKTDIHAAKTDAKGHFSFQSLRDGTYRLKTTRNGFGPAIGEVDVSASGKSEAVVLKIRYAI
jgi:Carboxypeptidase regulatory-like domain